jgi:hypothetical protein
MQAVRFSFSPTRALFACAAAFALVFAALSQPSNACPVGGTALELAAAPGVAHSRVCAQCHSFSPKASGLKDADGNNVAPYDLWQGTMMANAARDPLWQAVMSVEVAATPSQKDRIEAECLKCHSPMAEKVGLDKHGEDSFSHLLNCDSDLGQIAQDGVSCTICHGIAPDNLGSEASFSAGFQLNPNRQIFGPHENPLTPPMRNRAGFTPTYSAHVRESALCGSCHTLFTPAFRPDGSEVGVTFLEQAPYLEWRNSDFQNEADEHGPSAASCQDCHMSRSNADGSPILTRIARNPAGNDFPPTRPRQPFGKHHIVGGNTLVLGMFRDHGEALGASAPRAAFEQVIEETRQQLRERSARLAILDAKRGAERLRFTVQVQNLSGHKLPTAHPTRRAWLHIKVSDAQGRIVFENGKPDAQGRIVAGDGNPIASELAGGPIEAHRDQISRSDAPVVYQAIMADAEGAPTHILLHGASWMKDTRILPQGWTADHPEATRTRAIGTTHDPNFLGGSDRVQVDLPLDAALAGRELNVEVELLYQTLSARWAAEMFLYDTPQVARFRELYEAADRAPEILAAVSSTLPALAQH